MISMMIGSEFISALTHALAEHYIGERHRKKQNRHREEDYVLHMRSLPGTRSHSDSPDGPILIHACASILVDHFVCKGGLRNS